MTNLLIAYISFTHLFEFTLAYFLLDKLYLKAKINYGLVLLILFFGLYVGQNLSNLDTLVFYAILIALIVSVIQTFTKNEELKYQAKQRKIEYDMMSKYAEEVKKQYQDMRKFRHDYVNIRFFATEPLNITL